MSYGELKGFKDHFGFGGIAPDRLSNCVATQDLEKNNRIVLTWKDPKDTEIDGSLVSSWVKTTIVRKYGSYPESITDGVKIVENKIRDQYASDGYVDTDFVSGEDRYQYYYAAFPESDTGAISVNEANRFDNRPPYVLYGVKIAKKNSDPASRVTYLEDAIGMTPAKMNYGTGVFDYGSWGDAFFMPRPCMIKTGAKSPDYFLNPNDYTKKIDGSASDVANTSYDGDCMVQFPTIWFKYATDADYDYIYISDSQIDDTYHAYAHTDKNGAIMPYTYLPAYNGSVISNKLRSISGQTPINTKTASDEISYARAKGDDYYIEVLADRIMVNNLLLLIGRSTNTQAVFGNGYYTGGSQSSNPRITTGSMNTKGLFWGSNGSTALIGVKVFGIENWWGNQWRRLAGYINANGTQKIKLTRGKQDGSTVNDYNLDGSGYITIPGATPAGTSGGYISAQKMTDYGLLPVTASGSETTYECDGLWFNNSQVNYALVGGSCADGFLVGAFCVNLDNLASYSSWHIGAALSYKPTVTA